MNTLDRYILRELVGPFTFGVVAFTSLFVAGDILFEVARLLLDGVSFSAAGRLFLFSLPRIVVLTFPMSMLLATLLTLSRLSVSSEVVAMKAAGVSTRRVITPVILVSLVLSCMTFVMNETVVPAANDRCRQIVASVTEKSGPRLVKNLLLQDYSGGRLERLVFAERLDREKGQLFNVTVQEFESGKLSRVTSASRATWVSGYWQFMEGTVYNILEGGRVVPVSFRKQRSPLTHPPKEIAARQKSPEEMSAVELLGHIRMLQAQRANVRPLLVQLDLKFAIPFASIVFALVGAPLGIQSHRAATSVGFGVSVIIIFVYYVIMSISTALGQRGAIQPFIAAWVQNFVMGGIGTWMIMRVR